MFVRDHLGYFHHSVILTPHISPGSVASLKSVWRIEVYFGRFWQAQHLGSKKGKALYFLSEDTHLLLHKHPGPGPLISCRLLAKAAFCGAAWENQWWSHQLARQPPFLPLSWISIGHQGSGTKNNYPDPLAAQAPDSTQVPPSRHATIRLWPELGACE